MACYNNDSHFTTQDDHQDYLCNYQSSTVTLPPNVQYESQYYPPPFRSPQFNFDGGYITSPCHSFGSPNVGANGAIYNAPSPCQPIPVGYYQQCDIDYFGVISILNNLKDMIAPQEGNKFDKQWITLALEYQSECERVLGSEAIQEFISCYLPLLPEQLAYTRRRLQVLEYLPEHCAISFMSAYAVMCIGYLAKIKFLALYTSCKEALDELLPKMSQYPPPYESPLLVPGPFVDSTGEMFFPPPTGFHWGHAVGPNGCPNIMPFGHFYNPPVFETMAQDYNLPPVNYNDEPYKGQALEIAPPQNDSCNQEDTEFITPHENQKSTEPEPIKQHNGVIKGIKEIVTNEQTGLVTGYERPTRFKNGRKSNGGSLLVESTSENSSPASYKPNGNKRPAHKKKRIGSRKRSSHQH
ncbi:hypothetical protein BdWA1_000101 [Babesia duncani]|uniref:Uncharacterized protein n=1 Tax=Babesia duncani TaxID=323732 RepID=A0AAD9PLT3_9APIC|nr:hypothetical protein BdWA1_000101 [Babesia duncani]